VLILPIVARSGDFVGPLLITADLVAKQVLVIATPLVHQVTPVLPAVMGLRNVALFTDFAVSRPIFAVLPAFTALAMPQFHATQEILVTLLLTGLLNVARSKDIAALLPIFAALIVSVALVRPDAQR